MSLNLSGIRSACGISQNELAERTGTTRVTIAKIETRETRPSPELMMAIADVLGIENWWEVWTPNFVNVIWKGEAPI